MAIFKSPYRPVQQIPQKSFFDFLVTTGHKKQYDQNTAAYVDGISGEMISRMELEKWCLLFASSLHNAHEKGLERLSRGSTVCVFSPNTLLYPQVMLALGAAGICGAYANAAYLEEELAHAFKISGSSHMLVHPALLSIAVTTLTNVGFSDSDVRKRIIMMRSKRDIPAGVTSQKWVDIDDLMSDNVPLTKPEPFDGDQCKETAAIFFSSGTTGLSKAVALSHHNMVCGFSCSDSVYHYYKHGRDVILAVVPLFHAYGGILLVLYGFCTGVPVIVMPKFEPETFLASIQRFKVTVLPLVPPLLNFLCKHPLVAKYDITSVKFILVGAAPVSADAIAQTVDIFKKRGVNISIAQGYGLTETNAFLAYLPTEYMFSKLGSVGWLLPNIEGRIVDDNGNDVPQGEPGELWVRGPSIMKEYVGNPKATQESLTADGWFKTGDTVVIDSELFLTVVDRKKELIKYKGYQVAPAELEAVLFTHPLVADAGVIGVYSEADFSEVPRAYIVPKDPALLKTTQKEREKAMAEIHASIKAKVASYKHLRGGIVFVEAIPRSAAGKILRKDLRALAKTSAEISARARL